MKILICCLAASLTLWAQSAAPPDYSIQAIQYGTIAKYPLSGLMVGAPRNENLDIPLMFWLIRGQGQIILLDAGFHRQSWAKRYNVTGFVRPDDAVRRAGVNPDQVQDIILSHAHWDHAGGAELFPAATIWIQEEEYAFYTGPAWQSGGRPGGIEPSDMMYLVQRNTEGKLRLIDCDDCEMLPGIRVYTGARHTFASQYIRIEGNPPVVLASDNAYLYRNLETRTAIPTFEPSDRENNLRALERMIALAGSIEHVVPGHDPEVFRRYPTTDGIARIR